jgi:hypothetical protein
MGSPYKRYVHHHFDLAVALDTLPFRHRRRRINVVPRSPPAGAQAAEKDLIFCNIHF